MIMMRVYVTLLAVLLRRVVLRLFSHAAMRA